MKSHTIVYGLMAFVSATAATTENAYADLDCDDAPAAYEADLDCDDAPAAYGDVDLDCNDDVDGDAAPAPNAYENPVAPDVGGDAAPAPNAYGNPVAPDGDGDAVPDAYPTTPNVDGDATTVTDVYGSTPAGNGPTDGYTPDGNGPAGGYTPDGNGPTGSTPQPCPSTPEPCPSTPEPCPSTPEPCPKPPGSEGGDNAVGDAACTPVEVDGDAMYCVPNVTSENTCSATGEDPDNNRCPKKGAIATSGCVPGSTSYEDGACVLTTDTVCGELPDGNAGCIPSQQATNNKVEGSATSTTISMCAMLVAFAVMTL